MNTQRINVMVPPTPRVPRGAEWAANAAVWLVGKLSAKSRRAARAGFVDPNAQPAER